jgi:hypothetical protein
VTIGRHHDMLLANVFAQTEDRECVEMFKEVSSRRGLRAAGAVDDGISVKLSDTWHLSVHVRVAPG